MMRTKMTSSMRASLEVRVSELDERIELLERQREEDDSVDIAAITYQLRRERTKLSDALEQAWVIDDDPFDKNAIEIGDTVTVRNALGEKDTYVLVDAGVGARAGLNWVSAGSPLGAALIGSGRGEQLFVSTPEGRMAYVIVDFERNLVEADDSLAS